MNKTIVFKENNLPIKFIKSRFRNSLRKKIILTVLIVFLCVYAVIISVNYIQIKKDIIDNARQEAFSLAQIIAGTIYRNYEIPGDSREIQSYILGIKRYKNSIKDISLVSKDFIIVNSTDEKIIFRKTTEKDLTECIEFNKSNIDLFETNNEGFIRIIYPVSPGESRKYMARGALDLTISLKSQSFNLNRILVTTIISGIIIIAGIAIILLFFSGSVTKPINLLYSGFQKASKGNYDIKLDIASNDEIGFVTSSFNEMIASIKESKKLLREHADRLEDLRNFHAELKSINASNLVPVNIPTAKEIAGLANSLNEVIGNLKKALIRERRFISNVAHELRTPISEIRTLAEVVLKWPDGMDDQTKNNYEDILNSTRNMQNIVNTLLMLSRFESGSLKSQKSLFELKPLILSVWKTYSKTAAEKGIILDNNIKPGFSVFSDKDMFLLIIDNLLSNAVEYSVQSTVIILDASGDSKSFTFSVKNEFNNLSEPDLENMFEMFWRKEKARTSDNSHTGLGLSLVRALAVFLELKVKASITDKKFLNMTVSAI